MAKEPNTPPPAHTEGSKAKNTEKLKLAIARSSRRKRLPLKQGVLLQNRFTSLQTDEENLSHQEKCWNWLNQPNLLLNNNQSN